MMSGNTVYGNMWNKFLSGLRLIRDSLMWPWEIALLEVVRERGVKRRIFELRRLRGFEVSSTDGGCCGRQDLLQDAGTQV